MFIFSWQIFDFLINKNFYILYSFLKRISFKTTFSSENLPFLNRFILQVHAIVSILSRAVARSENLGGHIVLGGDNLPPPPG